MSDLAEAKSERVDLRMTPSAKRLLQQAAAAAHKSLSEFLLDAGVGKAIDTLTDRRVFVLGDAQWEAFNKALDNPPEHNPGLDDLLSHKPVWEK